MDPRLRTAATMLGLCLIAAILAVGGAAMLFRPIPKAPASEDDKVDSYCAIQGIKKGTTLRPKDVAVSVFNAGVRSGRARVISTQFVTIGFGLGTNSNAPEGTRVARVQVWTNDPDDPAAQLVASYLGGEKVIEVTPQKLAEGVVVVIGDDMRKVGQGLPGVRLKAAAEVCVPVAAAAP